VDVVFSPNRADRRKRLKARWRELLQLCADGRAPEWTCKKTAKSGDLYLFWVGDSVSEITAIGVSDGRVEEYKNPGTWDWTDSPTGWFCGFKPLVRLKPPIKLDDIKGDPTLASWWEKRPYVGRSKTLLANPKVARRMLGVVAKQNPKVRILLGDLGIWLIGGEAHLPQEPGIAFRPGYHPKRESAKAETKKERKTILLRENKLQRALYKSLCARYGKNSVGTEVRIGTGCSIDVVVRRNGEYMYYEIKSGACIRTCLREAIGQLIEYSYWLPGNVAERLIVVSESPLTTDAGRYLNTLRKSLRIPVYYQQFELKSKSLGKLQ